MVRSLIKDEINGAVEQVSYKLGINKHYFCEWKRSISSHINFQINKYKNKFQHEECKPIVNKTSVNEGLEKNPT